MKEVESAASVPDTSILSDLINATLIGTQASVATVTPPVAAAEVPDAPAPVVVPAVEERAAAAAPAAAAEGTLPRTGSAPNLEERMGLRLEATEHRLLATFRGELHSAITGQTRTMALTLVGTMLTSSGLAFTAARLAS